MDTDESTTAELHGKGEGAGRGLTEAQCTPAAVYAPVRTYTGCPWDGGTAGRRGNRGIELNGGGGLEKVGCQTAQAAA